MAQESVKLDEQVIGIARTIAQQSGRSINDVVSQAVYLYSTGYMDGFAAAGRALSQALTAPRPKLVVKEG